MEAIYQYYESGLTTRTGFYQVTMKGHLMATVKLTDDMPVPLQKDVMQTIVDELNRFSDFVLDPLNGIKPEDLK